MPDYDPIMKCPFWPDCRSGGTFPESLFDAHVGIPSQGIGGAVHNQHDWDMLPGLEEIRLRVAARVAARRAQATGQPGGQPQPAGSSPARPSPPAVKVLFSPVGPGRNYQLREEERRRSAARETAGSAGEDTGKNLAGRNVMDRPPTPDGGSRGWLDGIDCATAVLIIVVAGVLSGGLGIYTWSSIIALLT